MPIVIAYHLIWTVYGWWLPNDPRGSTSRTVAAELIASLGELHFGRKKIQPASRDVRAFYEQAARMLKHPLLDIHARAVDVVAAAFAQVIAQQNTPATHARSCRTTFISSSASTSIERRK